MGPAKKAVKKTIAKKAPAKKAAPKKSPAKKAAKKPAAKKASGKKDDKVKRAPSPYMNFCKDERPKIVKANPNMAFGEVGKALGAARGKLSDAQKAKYKK